MYFYEREYIFQTMFNFFPADICLLPCSNIYLRLSVGLFSSFPSHAVSFFLTDMDYDLYRTFFMFVPHLFDFLSVTDNAIHCGFSAVVLQCHRLLMIIQEATRTAERLLWIGVLLDGYEIV